MTCRFPPDGKQLFFVSNRPVTKDGQNGKENIWVMDRSGSGWGEPRPLPASVNSMRLHWQVSTDLEGNLYWGGFEERGGFGIQDIYRSKLKTGRIPNPRTWAPRSTVRGSNTPPSSPPMEAT